MYITTYLKQKPKIFIQCSMGIHMVMVRVVVRLIVRVMVRIMVRV